MLISLLRYFLFNAKLLSAPSRSNATFNLRHAKSILIIRLDNIGDMILCSSFFRELRANAPKAYITLLVRKETYPLMEMCPYVNEILQWAPPNRKGRSKFRHFLYQLRFSLRVLWSRKFEYAILPRFGKDGEKSNLLAYLSGASIRIGYSEKVTPAKAHYNSGEDAWLTFPISQGIPVHQVEKNLHLLRSVGLSIENDALETWVTSEDELIVRKLLLPRLRNNKFIIMAVGPGARNAERRWCPEHFTELLNRLLKEQPIFLVIVGGIEDREIELTFPDPFHQRVLDVRGLTNLRETISILKHCHLFLGNDSGPKHMAAAVGLPVIEINSLPIDYPPSHDFSVHQFGAWKTRSTSLHPPAYHGMDMTKHEWIDLSSINRLSVSHVYDVCVSFLKNLKPMPLQEETA